MMQFVQKYRPEILGLMVVLVGAVFLVQRFLPEPPVAAQAASAPQSLSATPTWKDVVRSWRDAVVTAATEGVQRFAEYMSSLTLQDGLGWILILPALGFLVLRGRNRYLTSIAWTQDACPRCGRHLHRVHRTLADRLLGASLQARIRRYRCAEAECGWCGLRYAPPRRR